MKKKNFQLVMCGKFYIYEGSINSDFTLLFDEKKLYTTSCNLLGTQVDLFFNADNDKQVNTGLSNINNNLKWINAHIEDVHLQLAKDLKPWIDELLTRQVLGEKSEFRNQLTLSKVEIDRNFSMALIFNSIEFDVVFSVSPDKTIFSTYLHGTPYR